MRTAAIASVIANVFRGKDSKAFGIDDFMLKFDAEKKPRAQTEAQIEAALKLAVKIHNKRLADAK